MKKIVAKNLRKKYENFELNVSFDIDEKEFVSVLGPSGSGKSTLLHLIAGFILPDSGTILKDGYDITHVPANKRNIGVVFQDYALFPYMNVYSNIAFGLRLKKEPARSIREKVQEISEKFGIENILRKYPDYISGGEKQRVALARAMIVKPDVLLMDEPLSSLDAKIREKLMKELRNFHKEFGITIIYVTHDQTEAMYLSDRIILLNNGKVEQIGIPIDLYKYPKSAFAREFIGKINRFAVNGKEIFVRPEEIVIKRGGKFSGIVEDIVYLNGIADVYVRMQKETILITELMRNVEYLKVGDKVSFDIKGGD